MLSDVFQGVRDYRRALSIASQLKLWGYFLLPGIISLALGTLVLSCAWFFSDDLGALLTSWYKWERGANIAQSIATAFSGLLMIVLGLIIYKYILIIILGPLMDPLSQRVEEHLRGEKFGSVGFRGNIRALTRGVRLSLRMVFRETAFVTPFVLIGFLPAIGFVGSAIVFIIQAYYAGMGNLDYALGRHLGVGESIQFTRQHRAYAIGSGAIYLLLLFIPILGLFIAPPLATIAATIGGVERVNRSKDTLLKT